MSDNSRTVCIKMTTGEEIFTELIHDEEVEKQNLIKLYQPYSVKIIHSESGVNLMLNPWQLFTDDMTYYVQADHVVSINTLDSHHKRLYGSMVVNSELKVIQGALADHVKESTITSKIINDSLKDTLHILMKGGIRYQLPLPERKQIEADFWSFIMGQYENEPTAIQ